MGNFNLGRVAQYARYHYTSQYKQYLAFALFVFGIPLIFGILDRSIYNIEGIALAIYIFGAMRIAMNQMLQLRGRGTKVIASTLPISNEERFSFMLFDCAVVYPLVAFALTLLAVICVAPFQYGGVTGLLGAELKDIATQCHLYWPIYILVQIITSTSLLINILARRSLVAASAIGFGIIIAILALLARLGISLYAYYTEMGYVINNIVVPESVGVVMYCLIPVVLYAICYIALRKRQIKW
ncbi:MAG: hypothetical protein J6R38_02320 [Alistipes sp.]|nr:hypothetical protein [Alistipes sp.]